MMVLVGAYRRVRVGLDLAATQWPKYGSSLNIHALLKSPAWLGFLSNLIEMKGK